VRARLLAGLAVLVLALSSPPAFGWGFTAHRLVNRTAVSTLPPPLREWFTAHVEYLTEHSIDPDLWRGAGLAGEGPNHYLDLDAFGTWPFEEVSREEAVHLERFGAEARERGRLPWRVQEVYAELVAAFRARDSLRILERAAVLGHYVGDGHVPFHAILNYDGQLTGQKGLHARWESEMVDRFLRQIEGQVEPGAARAGAKPIGSLFDALVESAAETASGLEADRELRGERDFADTPEDDRYDDAYYSALYGREGFLAAARISRAAERLGSLWLTAWEEAGRPLLDPAFRVPYVRGKSRLIVASLDGAAAPLVKEAVDRGLMPHLAALRREGATALGAITSLPAKTASGHATLYTGAWPDVHGVTGNEVVFPEASLLAPVSGYRSEALRAEPLWVTAAREGLSATLLCATQDFPYEPYEKGRRFGGDFGRDLTLLTGYKGAWLGDAVYRAADLGLREPEGWSPPPPGAAREIELTVGETRLFGLLFDDPKDPAHGLDTLALAINKDGPPAAVLKPVAPAGPEAFAPVRVRFGGRELPVFFRLFALSPDGRDILLYRAKAASYLSNRPALPALLGEAGFVGNGAAHLYEAGALGPPLAQGGAGLAEARYLETVRLVERQFEGLLDFGATRTRWDVLVGYLPFPDEFLHLWWGYLDPQLPGHDPVLARRLRPYLDEGLRIADAYVGALRRKADAATLVAIGADHGMTSVRTRVRMNAALREAGLLAVDGSGRPDLGRTKAYYLDASGYFLLNRAARPGGVVRPEEERDVLAKVRAVLQGLRDPRSGEPLVNAVLEPGEVPGTGGPQGGDLYFRLAPHVFPTGESEGPVVYDGAPRGEHLLVPETVEMHASFTVSGPGTARGVDLGVIRQIDVAPTLSALLGLGPPRGAVGSVLETALAKDGGRLPPPR